MPSKRKKRDPSLVALIGNRWCKMHNNWGADPMEKLDWYMKNSLILGLTDSEVVRRTVPDADENALCLICLEENNKMTHMLNFVAETCKEWPR